MLTITEDAAKKMEGFLANSKTKADTEMLNKANAAREKAYEIVKNSAEFMHTFNDLYDKLKPALFNEDHVKVANAIIKLNDIRPHELIKEAGILKRIRTIKYYEISFCNFSFDFHVWYCFLRILFNVE